MALSNRACQAAKPKIKSYKMADGEGLYLEVTPAGTKLWRLKYRLYGKEKRISIGSYPDVSIVGARQAKEEIKKEIKAGIDPVLKRQQAAQINALNKQLDFRSMAMEWYWKQVPLWKPKHATIIKHRFEKYVFPFLGHFPLTEIKPLRVNPVCKQSQITCSPLGHRHRAGHRDSGTCDDQGSDRWTVKSAAQRRRSPQSVTQRHRPDLPELRRQNRHDRVRARQRQNLSFTRGTGSDPRAGRPGHAESGHSN